MKANKRVTDFTYLISLSDEDESFMDEMKDIFLKENPEEIRLLAQAIEEQNYKQIMHLSHQIRSSIPFVGLDLLLDKSLMRIGAWAEGKKEIEKISRAFILVKKICEQAFLELMP